jgi:ABC-type sugar transport system substrate-binding protein
MKAVAEIQETNANRRLSNTHHTLSSLLRLLRPRLQGFATFVLAFITILTGCSKPDDAAASPPSGRAATPAPTKKLTIAFLPKSKGNAYFISCKKGAERAARELGIDLLFDGPTDPDPARQNEIVDNWITLGVDAIAAACENKEGISTALRRARAKGVKVITYDADALTDAREFFVNQATPQGIGDALMDEAARLCHTQGEFAVIIGSLTAANQSEWRKYIELRRAATYPTMKLVAVRPCDDLKDKAQSEATTLLGAYPNLKLFLSTTSLGVPGAAEAVKQAGKTGQVKVIGLGLPSENRRYVKEGVTDSVILWKTEDLGYLAIQAAAAVLKGTLKPGDQTFKAGALGEFQIQGDNIVLGKPFIFNRANIDQFDF